MSDKREAILRASAQEIARHGVRGLRVTEVAAGAGVSTALLYYHFTDRTGLLDAALRYMTDRANNYRLALDAPGDSAWQRLVNHLTQEFQDDPIVVETTLAWGELRATAVYEPELRASIASAAEVWRGEVRESILEVRDAGELTSGIDVDAASAILVVLMEGLGAQWMCGEITVVQAQQAVTVAAESLLRR